MEIGGYIDESSRILEMDESKMLNKPTDTNGPNSIILNTWLDKMWFVIRLMISSLPLAIMRIGYSILSSYGMRIADSTGSAVDMAALGLTIITSNMIIYPFQFGSGEKVSIDSSYYYGSGKYNEMKKSFLKGVMIFFIHTILIYIIFIRHLKHIFIWMNIDVDLCIRTHDILQYIIVTDTLSHLRIFIIYYLVSQEIEKGFIYFVVISLSIAMSCCYYFTNQLKLGLMGWIYSTYIYESTLMIQVLIYFYICNRVGPFTLSHLESLCTDKYDYYIDVLQCLSTLFIESIGCETSLYMCTQLHHNSVNEAAAYSSIMNICSICYMTLVGYCIISRSMMNRMIGNGNIEKGKAIYNISTIGIIIIISIMGGALFIFRNDIVALYAHSHPEVSRSLTRLLSHYSTYLIFGYALYPFTFSVARMMKLTNLLLVLDVVILVIVHICIDVTIIHTYEYATSIHIFMSLMWSFILIHLIILIKIYVMDWNKI